MIFTCLDSSDCDTSLLQILLKNTGVTVTAVKASKYVWSIYICLYKRIMRVSPDYCLVYGKWRVSKEFEQNANYEAWHGTQASITNVLWKWFWWYGMSPPSINTHQASCVSLLKQLAWFFHTILESHLSISVVENGELLDKGCETKVSAMEVWIQKRLYILLLKVLSTQLLYGRIC